MNTYERFPTAEAFVRKALIKRSVHPDDTSHAPRATNPDFFKSADMSQAEKWFREYHNGLLDGELEAQAKNLESIVSKFRPVFDETLDYVSSPVGGYTSYPRWAAGLPDANVRWVTEEALTCKKAMKCVVNGCYNYTVSAQERMYCGVAMFAMVQILRKIGLTLDLWLEIQTRYNSSTYACRFPIQESRHPLNLKKIMYFMISTDILRRFYFSIIEQQENSEELGARSTYGFVEEPMKRSGDELILNINKRLNTEEKIIPWVTKTLEELGLDSYVQLV